MTVTEITVHACPPEGSGLTPCCQRPPLELPRTDRMTSEPGDVTCVQVAAAGLPLPDPADGPDEYLARCIAYHDVLVYGVGSEPWDGTVFRCYEVEA